ncbi:hypothetical protein SD81_034545 [Tolypothrix campylonemoides VB511288]|nr:hypothetical protein SD81_034545 [Tolypothrix campylonemoides VB511288]
MSLLLLRSVWSGSSNVDELVEQTIAAGLNGIEVPIPRDESEQRKLRQCLSDGILYHVRLITYNSCLTSLQPSPFQGEGAVGG